MLLLLVRELWVTSAAEDAFKPLFLVANTVDALRPQILEDRGNCQLVLTIGFIFFIAR